MNVSWKYCENQIEILTISSFLQSLLCFETKKGPT